MTKLSEKDQEFLKRNSNSTAYDFSIIMTDIVRMYLIQKDIEHKVELKRLNRYIAKMQVDQVELIKKERARWQKEDLDALSQHDKQVMTEFNKFVRCLEGINGIDKLMVHTLVVKYLNKIKEQ